MSATEIHPDMFPEARSRPEDDENSRYTPRALMLQLHREFRFTVDAASAADAPSSAVIGRFWNKADDGLAKSWRGERTWINPPFDDLEAWVAKAWAEVLRGGCPLAVMLIPANRTEQPFWHKHIEGARDRGPQSGATLQTRFLPGRVSFGHPGNPDGANVGSPPFGCVLLIWSAPLSLLGGA